MCFQNATLAVSSLTITSDREEAVDFTKPYKPRGLSIVMKKSEFKSSFFQFLDPLSPEIWILIAVVLVSVSLCLFVVDRVSTHQEEDNVFKPSECIWFTFASLVLNSTNVSPRTIPTKILAGTVWFFSLILISNYTANLAAFLTISKFDTPIHSVYDFGKQTKVKYGTVWNSATSSYFEYSQVDYFRKMWQFMAEIQPDNMVNFSKQGFEKVKKDDDYAFIWDDDVVRYEVNKDCELQKVGGVFDGSKGYGIAMPKNAGYRDDISMAILKLSEQGVLQKIEHR